MGALQQGSNDAAGVRRLQALLNERGASPKVQVDGAFGARTRAAVRDFQRKNGLAVDGVAGPQTMAALQKKAPDPGQQAPPGQAPAQAEPKAPAAAAGAGAGAGGGGAPAGQAGAAPDGATGEAGSWVPAGTAREDDKEVSLQLNLAPADAPKKPKKGEPQGLHLGDTKQEHGVGLPGGVGVKISNKGGAVEKALFQSLTDRVTLSQNFRGPWGIPCYLKVGPEIKLAVEAEIKKPKVTVQGGVEVSGSTAVGLVGTVEKKEGAEIEAALLKTTLSLKGHLGVKATFDWETKTLAWDPVTLKVSAEGTIGIFCKAKVKGAPEYEFNRSKPFFTADLLTVSLGAGGKKTCAWGAGALEAIAWFESNSRAVTPLEEFGIDLITGGPVSAGDVLLQPHKIVQLGAKELLKFGVRKGKEWQKDPKKVEQEIKDAVKAVADAPEAVVAHIVGGETADEATARANKEAADRNTKGERWRAYAIALGIEKVGGKRRAPYEHLIWTEYNEIHDLWFKNEKHPGISPILSAAINRRVKAEVDRKQLEQAKAAGKKAVEDAKKSVREEAKRRQMAASAASGHCNYCNKIGRTIKPAAKQKYSAGFAKYSAGNNALGAGDHAGAIHLFKEAEALFRAGNVAQKGSP